MSCAQFLKFFFFKEGDCPLKHIVLEHNPLSQPIYTEISWRMDSRWWRVFLKTKRSIKKAWHYCNALMRGVYFQILSLLVGFCSTIFQTAWHFAPSSSLKFLHGDHNTDNDWIFNRIQFVFVEHGFVVNKTYNSGSA